MEKFKYGDIVLETGVLEEVLEAWDKYTKNDFKKGDCPKKLELTGIDYNFVLVVNSDDFLDCEYRLAFNENIYSLEEIKELKNKIKISKSPI